MKSTFFICLFCIAFCKSLIAQTITGNVIDGFDKGYLEDVVVINLANGDQSITNTRGYFRVKGNSGDSLSIIKEHYIPHGVKVGTDTHIIIEINLNARLLPRFDVYGEKYRISMSMDGSVSPTGMRGLTDRKAGPGKVYLGMSDNPGLAPAITIDGPISYFMKSERQKRQYARKLAFLARQQDYLELIQSDSVMTALKSEYNLSNQDLDDLIIEFNLQNRDHQFLDMNWKMVEQRLIDFFDRRTGRKR
ncbi:hypothetical protein MM236_15485 [Belliella sp. DSM 107340]|uniref:CarboxypepD_reg-like domain-containing protein n=1 Tax=Belliella calami TaxID=2923436 RepID=A0ABS9US29_9BACT|nr:hypothetical protein [Belliella calami]MCH7399404.1 hypothetical protein [Belliella calami]